MAVFLQSRSFDNANDARFISESGISPLCALALSDDMITKGESFRCLANLATTPALQTQVVQLGAVQPLIGVAGLEEGPPEGRKYAILALANLSATVTNHTVLLEDGVLRALNSLANAKDAMTQ